MIKTIKITVWEGTLFVLVIGMLWVGLRFQGEIARGIAAGMAICLQGLIPSLFFFLLLALVIGNSGLATVLARPFLWAAKRLMRLDATLFSLWLLSLLGGYPVGAKLIGDHLAAGRITPQTAKQLLPICVNCSPAFLVSYVAFTLWGNLSLGVLLWGAQVLSCLILAVIMGWGRPVRSVQSLPKRPDETIATLLVTSIIGATKTMAIICGFVLAFSAVLPLLSYLPLSSGQQFFLTGGLEVVAGVQSLAGMPLLWGVLCAALFTSFGGVCVFLQVFAVLGGRGISLWYLLALRLCYTVLSVVLTWIGFVLLPPAARITAVAVSNPNQSSVTLQPFAHSLPVALGLLLLGAMLLAGGVTRPPAAASCE